MSTTGTLFGLGVGPGDPELLTLRAWRLISNCDVIAYPHAGDGDSLARRICAPFIPEETEELAIEVPMRTDRQPAKDAYDAAALKIAHYLNQGRHVAFLCEGDPFFYGSFMYLFERLSAQYKTVIVPGVSSLTASAAAISRPLAARNDVLTVIPAPLPVDTIRQRIEAADAFALIKIGRHFDKVRGIVRDLGLEDRAMIVESASGDNEKVTALADIPEGERPYFSTILIYKGTEPW
jgi:precorrin-2/cobalt-factor-2 C20-methyltransferase